ncbi:WAT1-related protein At1g68170-like [Cornus florida]|uniref:WAT1-related protein At1g68170-like n=1 Tax=Cornus florida TaxID=4283 RepID=UPI0028A2034C|nr:WAT1-related protein At1g68170-like [Cornus florida]
MGKICNAIHGLKPTMMMVVVQMAYAGMNIFYKLAANDGMSMRVLVAYRFTFAAAFIIPLALYVERNSRPKLTWIVVFQAFLCGLFGGSLGQNLYAQGLVLTSATFASAMTNLVPAITFVMAISIGLEKLGLGTTAGKAKLVGTAIGIGGAMLLTFYKGVEINIWSTNIDLLHHNHDRHVAAQGHPESSDRVLGAFLVVCGCFCIALWLIIQAKMVQRYPCLYSGTALISVMGAIQAIGFALCMERDWSRWKLGWNIKLVTIFYSGIVASGLVITLTAWCVRMRGPLFASIFSPLMLVLVAIAGSLLLNEKLHLGSILGAVLIVCGLYAVLWGKGKEMKKNVQLMPSKSSKESERINIILASSLEKTNDNKNDNISSNVTEVNP